MRRPPLYKSFTFAAKGLVTMFKSERNFRIECIALIINIFLIIFLGLSKIHSAIILALCIAVMITEVINTAIEKICDLINTNYDTRIKYIKDISAAAVLLMSLLALLIGIIIYSDYITI